MKICRAVPGRLFLLAALMALVSSGTVRADPFDDLNNTEIPRDISSNSRIERIQVWGTRIQPPPAPTISPLDYVNISISLMPPKEGGICLNCDSEPRGKESDEENDPSILEDLKQGAKIIWSVVRRSKGGAVRFMFQSAPLGDYCSDKPQDIACQRNIHDPEQMSNEDDFGVERYDLMHIIHESGDIESSTLFGYPLDAVASAVFDKPVKPEEIRIDSFLQDDATGKLVLTFAVELPFLDNADRRRISRPHAPPIRIDRDGRVFIEP